MKLSDYVIYYLEQIGVRDVFLLSGGGMMHLLDSVSRSEQISTYYNLNEQATSICADAYGQYTNHLGVCMVTTGPGATNAITGVVSAFQDSTPMLVISGQVKTTELAPEGVRVKGLQEVQITKLVKDVTKYAVTVMNKEDIRYHLEKAIHLATTGRKGPVWIDIPLDIQAAEIIPEQLKGFQTRKQNWKISGDMLHNIKYHLMQAKRPLILYGQGVLSSGAKKEALRLTENLNIPFTLNWRAKGLADEDHSLFFGFPGSPAPRYSNFILQNADFLLVVGSRLNAAITAFNPENFAKHAKKFVVDIDKNELDLLDEALFETVHCDAKIFLKQFLQEVENQYRFENEKWINFCSQMKQKYPVYQERMSFDAKGIYGFDFSEVLSRLSDDSDVFVVSPTGRVFTSSVLGIHLKGNQQIVVPSALGSMGYGLPSVIGVCVASKKRRTIIFEGDGSLQHNLQELQLLKTYQLPIKLFIYNNSGYSSIYSMQNNHFKGNLAGCTENSGVALPELERIAKMYDLNYVKISSNNELTEGITKVLSDAFPTICEVVGDIRFEEIPRAQTKVNPDGTLSSSSLEELYPFIGYIEKYL